MANSSFFNMHDCTAALRGDSNSASESTDGALIVSVSEIQRKCVGALKRIEDLVGIRFIAVDSYTDPRIKFWCVGITPEQKRKLLDAIVEHQLWMAIHGGIFNHSNRLSNLYWLVRNKDLDAISSIDIFFPHVVDGTVVHGRRSGVTVEFPVFSTKFDEFVAPNFSAIQKSIHRNSLGNLKTIKIHGFDFLAAPNLLKVQAAGIIPAKVDLIYTWVNGNDPEWRARRAQLADKSQDKKAVNDGDAAFRYLSRNELLFSLRSAATYFTGVGKIYIVTDRQIPSFLSLDSDQVIVVDHREIFKNPSNLPTFNSHAIESQIHRIPNLSDKYLYLNDDFLFGRPVNPFLFFDEYNRSRFFYTRAVTIPEGVPKASDRGVDAAAKNAREQIFKKFGVYITRKFKHTPVPMIKDVVHRMEEDFPDVFQKTAAARLRSSTDVCVSGSFYFHYASVIGRACEGDLRYDYLDFHSSNFASKLRRVTTYDTYCINDGEPSEYTETNEAAFLVAMEKTYPVPAHFEKITPPTKND
jgi:hypothetical protein